MNKFVSTLIVLLLIFSCGIDARADNAYAAQNSRIIVRNNGLETPDILRPRVNFWKDVFTKYGKYQLIVHHRRFPQIVFKVLDFSKAAQDLSPYHLDALKKKIEKEKVEEMKGYLKNLARTGAPSNSMEEFIVKQMANLPGTTSKYQDMLDNDWVRTQTGIKERYQQAVERTGRYLPGMERIFAREYGLPVELTRLPFVESSFDYTAYSSVGAAGIWQFMRGTAKKMMTINNFVDERLDPFVATRAAATYLQHAYKSLGTWPMAVTSYNHGVAGVYKKMQGTGTRDLASVIEQPNGEPVFGFASSNFFPEFLAAVEIYNDYLKYFPGLRLLPELRVREYRVPKPVYIQQVARTLGVDKDDLLSANYALLSPVATGRKAIPAGYVLRVPLEASGEISKLDSISNAPAEADKKKEAEGAASSVYGGTLYTVRKGDTLLSLSKKFKVSVDVLRQSNNLTAKELIPGQTLTIRTVPTKKTTVLIKNPPKALPKNGKKAVSGKKLKKPNKK